MPSAASLLMVSRERVVMPNPDVSIVLIDSHFYSPQSSFLGFISSLFGYLGFCPITICSGCRMERGSWVKFFTLSVLLTFVFVALATTNPSDYAVLDEFRKGLSNVELLGWPANNQDPCGSPQWNYVYCSNSRVTQIQAKNLGLVGTLPVDFNKLSMLENIGLQGNNLTGALPSLKGLSKVEFVFLDDNQFDTIPSDFFVGLDSLQVLALDKNPLNQSTGWMLPLDLGNSAQLVNLSLMQCNLIGPLPDFLGNLHSLSMLKLSYNKLTGEIPVSYSSLPLQILWLNNQEGGLTGSLEVFTSMTMLNDVWLHGNQFTGRIPSSIGALTSLTRLWLNNNRLVGIVPVNLTSLPELQSLHLDDNSFMGPIPTVSFSDFTYSYNSFCQSTAGAPCPQEVAALLDFLDAVDYPPILANSWKGNDSCVGTWIGVSCTSGSISVINLPNNHLNGTISPSLANLDSLVRILLGSNNLSGTIPEDLTGLKFLKLLNLSSNNISPPVPQFPSSVKVILDDNSLLNNGSSPSGSNSHAPSNQPSPSSGVPSPTSSSSSKVVVLVVPVAVAVSVFLLVLIFLLQRKKRKNPFSVPNAIVVHPRNSSDPDNFVKIAIENNSYNTSASELHSRNNTDLVDTHVIESGDLIISVQILRTATRNFAPENVLGQGGFGIVYKGELHDGTMIAVKRMQSVVLNSKALEEFQAEIAILSKVRHRNLVSIVGYSVEDNERLLVYEYMPQGALSKHLFEWKEFEVEPLSWKKRLNIALDVARGIEYLHNFASHCFIHRDLKSSNILLDDDYRAKISDFGLAKLAPDGKNSLATKLAGTFGYLAPEYAVTGKVTTKVDVFSFGVVLMELLTGLRALDEGRPDESRYLASWFCQMKNSKENLRSIIDSSLAVTDESCFERIRIVAELAGHCTAREPYQRPDMSHAVNVLAPLVEKWMPVSDDQDEHLGIDFCQPLLQMVKGWQAADGAPEATSISLDYSKGSIPARPIGFAESFTSADAR
ncbi:hypothetical protein ZIOFF_027464 [Zingiber officinale]|uniref:Protein kinase domain-containing protein n=2 Tax=Zingiber officinale TaxID=94328 RepID=A0A8J5LD70_ZINOF|nr:hypothetical protein ZIOFF_027464 [Zingiber officinale]